jgi:hypothetical protein
VGVIRERIYQDKNDPNILLNDMTTIDTALTRPWSVQKKYRRLRDVRWPENNCTEGNSDVVIGNEQYMIGGDGNLMPVKKDQPAPDLRHFNRAQR